MTYEFKSGTELFEERYVSYDDAGVVHPSTDPRYAWVWGDNSWKQLGLGDTTHRTAPTSPPPYTYSTAWKDIGGTSWMYGGIRTNGTLWTWGNSEYVANLSVPTQVGSLTDWKSFDAWGVGSWTSLASIKTDGTLWMWGNNYQGQLGLGNTQHRSSPVQVGSLTDWKQLTMSGYTSTSFGSTHAVKTDGTLWAWGGNSWGQLGLGDSTRRLSPVQVGSSNDWKQVSSTDGANYPTTIAVKTNGTLWAWGYNYGVLQYDGTSVHRSSPVQVGSLTDWSYAVIDNSSIYATKTNGTLWAWGLNDKGQLGHGDRTHRSSPVQVGSLTNWAKVSANLSSVMAIKTDGTLWAWGNNYSYGQLGLGDMAHRSSPVQVGAMTNWTKALPKNRGSCGLTSFY